MVTNFQNLIQFRKILFQMILKRRSAVINLIDALSVDGRTAKSVVQLSNSKFFERNYCSATRAITEGLAEMNWVQTLCNSTALPEKSEKYHRFVLDCTSTSRGYSDKLSDRSSVYSPNPTPGNKPITIGHNYSVVAKLATGNSKTRKNWIHPLSTQRVKSDENSIEKGMSQLEAVIQELGIVEEKVLSIGDSSYGNKQCLAHLQEKPNQVHLFRVRNNRCVWETIQPDPSQKKKRGGQKHYGRKMSLDKPETYFKTNQTSTFSFINRKGKEIFVEAKEWKNLVFRGKQKFSGYNYPFSLLQYRLRDSEGKLLYSRPLWLAVVGDWREEISVEEYFSHYQDRYDIEHFFRFGKNNLLLDQYQSPETTHEESWWNLVCLAYQQLSLAKEEASSCPNEWEKNLPAWKNHPQGLLSPSQTQRSFAKVLEQIGTPATPCIKRGLSQGRQQGEIQVKRESQAIQWKNKKKLTATKTRKKNSLHRLEKEVFDSNYEMNQESLLEMISITISKSKFTLQEIGKALLEK